MSTLEKPTTLTDAELATWPDERCRARARGPRLGHVLRDRAHDRRARGGSSRGSSRSRPRRSSSANAGVLSAASTPGAGSCSCSVSCACLAALSLTTGSELARWFGITVAGVDAIGQLLFVDAYPWWAMAMFAVDILIIYGLAAYGGARLQSEVVTAPGVPVRLAGRHSPDRTSSTPVGCCYPRRRPGRCTPGTFTTEEGHCERRVRSFIKRSWTRRWSRRQNAPVAPTVRINVWSGPRNVSTALMYSFRQRADTRVVDEPLYAFYLSATSARSDHPMTAEILASMPTDGRGRARTCVICGPTDRPVLFFKQMAHHLVDGVPSRVLTECANVLLIRDPVEVLTTLVHQLPEPSLADIGIARQRELLHELRGLGQDPPVLDATAPARRPRGRAHPALRARRDPVGRGDALVAGRAEARGRCLGARLVRERARARAASSRTAPRREPVPAHVAALADEAAAVYRELLPWRCERSVPPRGAARPAQRVDPRPRRRAARAARRGQGVGVRLLVQGGDAVWEGLRAYDGRIFALDPHLDRLFASAKALAFADVPRARRSRPRCSTRSRRTACTTARTCG